MAKPGPFYTGISCFKSWLQHVCVLPIANFSVTCLVTWPLSGNEAESDFVLIQYCVPDEKPFAIKINNILTQIVILF